MKNNLGMLGGILLLGGMSIMLNAAPATCGPTSDTTVKLLYPNWDAFAAPPPKESPIKCGPNANKTYPVLCLLPTSFLISTDSPAAQATLQQDQITNNLHFALAEFPAGFNDTTYNIGLRPDGNTATKLYIDITPQTLTPNIINPGNKQLFEYTADLSPICGKGTSCGLLNLTEGTMHCCGRMYPGGSECFY